MQSEATKAMNEAGNAPPRTVDAPGVAGEAISEAMQAEGGNPSKGLLHCSVFINIHSRIQAQLQLRCSPKSPRSAMLRPVRVLMLDGHSYLRHSLFQPTVNISV